MPPEPRVNILMVDDHPENLMALQAVLEDLGENLVSASSGEEALKRLLTQDFAVILLDVHMPGMDGFETATLIRARPRTRHVPIIFLTAIHQSESHLARGYSVGAVDYVLKPFQPEVLRAKVGVFVELARKRDEMQAEVLQRARAERELRRLYAELESRVEQRTQELAKANWELAHAKEQLEANVRELERLQTLRDELTHMIVHDLRTPLTSILSGIHAAEALGPLQEEQHECLRLAVRGGETLLGMINDLLDIQRMEEGTLPLQTEELEPFRLIEESLSHVRQLASDRKLRLEREIEPDLPALTADGEQLCRTLVNLLGNAIRHTPRSGTVTISARLDAEAQAVVFAVNDTGQGIPRDAFERIFEKFGQVESRRTGGRHSTGLGLTFCKLAVEAHGGRIWVESEVGKGSTFSFTVPLRSGVGERETGVEA